MKTRANELFRVISLNDAKEQGQLLKWVLVRQLSSVAMGEVINMPIDWDEVTEVRFFDEEKEIRIFERDGDLCSAVIADSASDVENVDFRDRTISLEHKGAFGREITVREYFDYDEDGQIFVAATRLKGWR